MLALFSFAEKLANFVRIFLLHFRQGRKINCRRLVGEGECRHGIRRDTVLVKVNNFVRRHRGVCLCVCAENGREMGHGGKKTCNFAGKSG